MSVSLLLEMAASSHPDRTAVVSEEVRLTTQQLSDLAGGGAGVIAASNAKHVAYVGTGGAMLPVLIFDAARAAVGEVAELRSGQPQVPIDDRCAIRVARRSHLEQQRNAHPRSFWIPALYKTRP